MGLWVGLKELLRNELKCHDCRSEGSGKGFILCRQLFLWMTAPSVHCGGTTGEFKEAQEHAGKSLCVWYFAGHQGPPISDIISVYVAFLWPVLTRMWLRSHPATGGQWRETLTHFLRRDTFTLCVCVCTIINRLKWLFFPVVSSPAAAVPLFALHSLAFTLTKRPLSLSDWLLQF